MSNAAFGLRGVYGMQAQTRQTARLVKATANLERTAQTTQGVIEAHTAAGGQLTDVVLKAARLARGQARMELARRSASR